MRCLKFGLLLVLGIGVAFGQPVISTVANAASNIVQGFPDSGIAQGAVFVLTGSGMGPTPLVVAPAPFQSTTLSGTSVAVTVGTTTVNAPMYYASDGQVAALLPSNAPVGTGTVTVTYNGSASASVAVSIVANNIGIFTISQNGEGVAIVTYPDYSLVSSIPGTGSLGGGGPDTYAGAAHPGDILTIWATGLGPVSGSDASGSGLGVNMPSIPLTVLLGGVSITASYQGRSGCCVGEDQIVFTVPSNTPTGCAVPLAILIGSTISNYTVMPVAASGRTCTPQNPAYTAAAVQTMTTGSTPFNLGQLQLGREISAVTSNGITYEDYGLGSFGQASVTAANQPVVLSSFDTPPFGTCMAFNSANSSNPPLVSILAGIDAGSLTMTSSSGQLPMTDKGGTPTEYFADFSPQNNPYFSRGTYTLGASGGRDVGPFSVSFTIVGTPTWQNTDQNRLSTTPIVRANGFTINWTGGSAAYSVLITGTSANNNTPQQAASFSCSVPSTLGTFTVPSSILLALPSGPYGEIDFKPTLPPVAFSASGLGVGLLNFSYDTTAFVTFN